LGLGANADLAGVSVAFLVAGPVAFFAAGAPAAPLVEAAFFAAVAFVAAFLPLVAAFLAGAAAFFAGAAARFAAGAGALRDDAAPTGAFFAGEADFFVVAVAFFTDTVFFTEAAFFWAVRSCAATDWGEDLFPVLAAAGRDRVGRLAGVPLLAGVIVSSLTT
jgi:hypothetical protein